MNPIGREAAARALPEPIRYLAQRWAELFDPDAGPVSTVMMVASPMSTFAQCEDLAYAHRRGRRNAPSYGVLYDVLRQALDVTQASRNLIRWWPAETKEARRRLQDALLVRPGISASKQRNHLLLRAWPAVRRGVRPLQARCTAAGDGYWERMLDLVLERSGHSLSTFGDWQSFDEDIAQLAAMCRDRGRLGAELGTGLARAIRDAPDLPAAHASIRDLLNRPPHEYEVLLAVSGARSIEDPDGNFGCRVLDEESSWTLRSSTSAKRQLNAFVRANKKVRATTVAVRTQAWDAEQATAQAAEPGERLVAQLVARHRTSRFFLGEALTLRAGRGIQAPDVAAFASVKAAPLLGEPHRYLDEPIQLLRLAQESRLPVIAAVQCWMALEAIVQDTSPPPVAAGCRRRGGGPYDVLSDKLPRALALHSVRLGLTNLWEIARRAARTTPGRQDWERLQAFISVSGDNRLAQPNRWFDLVAATPPAGPAPSAGALTNLADAAWVLEDLRPTLGPFVSRQIWLWRLRLGDNRLLGRWAERRQQETFALVNHLYAIRNGAVHNGVLSGSADEAAARAAVLLLDVTLEVVAGWIPNTPKVPSGRGIDRLDARARHVLSRWSGPVRRQVHVDLARLTSPGGDGLHRA